MNKRNIYIAFALLLLGASGCAVTDFDRSADFAQYKRFAWGESHVDVRNPVYDSDLINKRVRQIVEEEFARRGIVRNEDNPDFIVSYHTYTEKKERTSASSPYAYRYFPFGFYPFAFGWVPFGYPYMMGAPQVAEYTEGTLIIDITDRRADELIWRGSVSGNVDDIPRLRKQIEKGVRAIMKKYPVTPDAPLNIERDPNVIS